MGMVAKVVLLYHQKYWKIKGFSGEAISDCTKGPAMNVFDNTHHNQQGEEQPALTVFIGGGVYKYWKDRPDFEKALI